MEDHGRLPGAGRPGESSMPAQVPPGRVGEVRPIPFGPRDYNHFSAEGCPVSSPSANLDAHVGWNPTPGGRLLTANNPQKPGWPGAMRAPKLPKQRNGVARPSGQSALRPVGLKTCHFSRCLELQPLCGHWPPSVWAVSIEQSTGGVFAFLTKLLQ